MHCNRFQVAIMTKIEKKSKKKTTKSATTKNRTTVQKTKLVGRAPSKPVTGVKTDCKSSAPTSRNKPRTKTTTPAVVADKKVKKSIRQPSTKRTLVQSSSKPQPPKRQSVITHRREESARWENPLEQKQFSPEELRTMLLERRNGILKNIDDEIAPTYENKIPVVAGDVVDLALESSKNDLSLHLAEVESRELGQIDKAIQKIGEGTYGVCEKCGNNISPARLKALPFANMCICCQEEDERENY